MATIRGDGEAGRFCGKGACSASDGFFTVVDDLDVALGVGVHEAGDLSREVEDKVWVAGAVTTDGERGDRVLEIVAQVPFGVDDLQAAGGYAIRRDRNHHSIGKLARWHGTVGKGVGGKLVRQVIGAMAGGE